jgi:hypothetical protein
VPINIDFQKAAENSKPQSAWTEAVGNLRSGKQYPGQGPTTLPEWRLTADTKDIAQAIADQYGGDVQEWETTKSDRFEVLTTTPSLAVQLHACRAEMILWGNRVPTRVCDGQTRSDQNQPGDPCKCANDYPNIKSRKDAARVNEACAPSVQLLLGLVDLPDVGLFKWTTSSWLVLEDYANWLEEQAALKSNVVITKVPYQLKSGESRQKTTFELLVAEAA